jgi:hypothetical protein
VGGPQAASNRLILAAALRLGSLTRRTIRRAVIARPLRDVNAVYFTFATWAPDASLSKKERRLVSCPDGPAVW